jgi:hypothetical protein
MPDPLLAEPIALLAFLARPDVSIIAHLGTQDILDDFDQVSLSDMVEASFDGYAPIPLSGVPEIVDNEDDYGEALYDPIEWVAGSAISPTRITCVYLTLTGGGNPAKLMQLEPFDIPIIFDTPNQSMRRQIRIISATDV